MALLRQLEAGESLQSISESVTIDDAKRPLPRFAGCRVLVADDAAVNREVAFEALHRLGVEAKLVATGAAAVAAVANEHFDALLMDGSMPEMDGYAAAREIRRREQALGHSRLPIVALTAHVIGAAAEEWRLAGMDAVLHKPFTLAALAQTLAALLPSVADASVATLVQVDPPPTVLSGLRQRDDLFDLEAVAELEDHAANGRADVVERVIGLYSTTAPQRVAELQSAAFSGDAGGVAVAAHALKSMSYTIGAKAVATAAGQLEMMGLNGALPDDPALGSLNRFLSDTLTVLRATAVPSRLDPVDPFIHPSSRRVEPPAQLSVHADHAKASKAMDSVY
jgi:two-component system sensor histidine kinase BarA